MSNPPLQNQTPYRSIKDFDYHLPPDRIAHQPAEPRDHSRLLRLSAASGETSHHHFYDLIDFLQPGDVLVVNNSKVIRARLHASKPTGGKVEVFLLQKFDEHTWECMIGGRGITEGIQLTVPNPQGDDFIGSVLEKHTERTWKIAFNQPHITSVGEIPLPPYINSSAPSETVAQQYQTVYADPEGSVAAPTAGLHFTPQLLEAITAKGIHIVKVTLHVGLGTFAPVKTDNIYEHTMHSEYGTLPPETAAAIKTAQDNGGRVIAVGTTAARTLEAFHGQAQADWIDLFITPGYAFNTVDALITNFHLPKSTLLMLVAALAGKEHMDAAYQIAIQEQYRFYSFGDAMFIY